MKALKLMTIFSILVLMKTAYSSSYEDNYASYFLDEEAHHDQPVKKQTANNNSSDMSSRFESLLNNYNGESDHEDNEACLEKYRAAKERYLTEKVVFEQTKKGRNKEIGKGFLVALLGTATAITGNNMDSDALKRAGIAIGASGLMYSGFQGFKYYKDGKIEKPQGPSNCNNWDSENMDFPMRGDVICKKVTGYTYDQYGKIIEYKKYLCGEERIESYEEKMSAINDCVSCN